MGKELTQLQYVSCPNCHTMFKPRHIPKTPADCITCVCCKQIFTLAESYIYNRSRSAAPKRLRPKSKKQLSVKADVKNSTEQYLKAYRLKSRILFCTFISIPILMVGVLAGSIFQYKDELAQNLKIRPYLEQFCNILGCELQIVSNLDYVIVEDNAMVSVPDKENVIQVFAMLKNIGSFDQKYPNLKINFTDINGNLIQQKIFQPQNYLSSSYKNSSAINPQLLAKNSQQYISLLVPDPGTKAVNYEIILQ